MNGPVWMLQSVNFLYCTNFKIRFCLLRQRWWIILITLTMKLIYMSEHIVVGQNNLVI